MDCRRERYLSLRKRVSRTSGSIGASSSCAYTDTWVIGDLDNLFLFTSIPYNLHNLPTFAHKKAPMSKILHYSALKSYMYVKVKKTCWGKI